MAVRWQQGRGVGDPKQRSNCQMDTSFTLLRILVAGGSVNNWSRIQLNLQHQASKPSEKLQFEDEQLTQNHLHQKNLEELQSLHPHSKGLIPNSISTQPRQQLTQRSHEKDTHAHTPPPSVHDHTHTDSKHTRRSPQLIDHTAGPAADGSTVAGGAGTWPTAHRLTVGSGTCFNISGALALPRQQCCCKTHQQQY